MEGGRPPRTCTMLLRASPQPAVSRESTGGGKLAPTTSHAHVKTTGPAPYLESSARISALVETSRPCTLVIRAPSGTPAASAAPFAPL